jgi:hypothetical protein
LDDSGRVRLTCAACGVFVRLLRRRGDPAPEAAPPPDGSSEYALDDPPAGSWWLGLVRSRAGAWRAVALAQTTGEAWDALLTCPLAGAYLVMPTDPPRRGPVPAELPLQEGTPA